MQFNSLVSRYREWRKEQNAIVELRNLSNRELDDLGLSRYAIADAVRRGRR